MKKSLPVTALKKTYESWSGAINNADNLRRNLKNIMHAAPNTSKRVGITQKDIITIRRIEVKLSKLRDHIYNKQEVD